MRYQSINAEQYLSDSLLLPTTTSAALNPQTNEDTFRGDRERLLAQNGTDCFLYKTSSLLTSLIGDLGCAAVGEQKVSRAERQQSCLVCSSVLRQTITNECASDAVSKAERPSTLAPLPCRVVLKMRAIQRLRENPVHRMQSRMKARAIVRQTDWQRKSTKDNSTGFMCDD